MKKRIKIFIFGGDYFKYLLLVFGFFLLGLLFPCIFGDFFNVRNDAFSPFGFFCSSRELFQLILHNFVTFCIYTVGGMLLASSAFGFIFVPFLTFLCGCSLSYSVFYLLSSGSYFECYLVWLPMWSVYSAVILMYFTVSLIYSISLFKAQILGKTEEISLPESVKTFYFTACFSAIYSFVEALVEFLLLRLIQ